MNSPAFKILSVIASAFLFTVLLYKQHIGVNLFLFELVILGLLGIGNRLTKDKAVLLTVGGTLLTGLMIVIHNSLLAIMVNFMSLMLMTGVLLSPTIKSLIHSWLLAIVHLFTSHIQFFKEIGGLGTSNGNLGVAIRWVRIVAIPLFIVLVFVAIYSAANPVFDGMLASITDKLDAILLKLSEWVEFGVFWFFLFGMIVSDFLLLRSTEKNIEKAGLTASDNLVRTRNKVFKKKLDLGLKIELRSGILLLVVLNLLLLLINSIDIYWVWFNFVWEGDYLKQFVHEGTYLLIISILISIVISLYLFRGNQNFYKKSGLLKNLALAWMAQNVMLALSVGMRNIHYIEHYALAHKRIGVFFFLLATIIGLWIVISKIRSKKTFHYVIRTNAISVYSILVIMTLINWDSVVVKYNFKHYETTFTHLNFLSSLSYPTLPYQNKSIDFLTQVEESNAQFPAEDAHMDKWEYELRVNKRRKVFEEDWEARDWRSWNWAYHNAYRILNE